MCDPRAKINQVKEMSADSAKIAVEQLIEGYTLVRNENRQLRVEKARLEQSVGELRLSAHARQQRIDVLERGGTTEIVRLRALLIRARRAVWKRAETTAELELVRDIDNELENTD